MCVTLFFDMRSYKIESYVPEANFLSGKDARFCRAAFEDCFVIDVHNNLNIIASCRGDRNITFSLSDAAELLTLFNGEKEFLILPASEGTFLVYPAWRHLKLALVFFFKEDAKTIENAYQTAQRYAFSTVFNLDETGKEINQRLSLEAKLCALRFYTNRLFGVERETNITAQILMIANLMGCQLHEMSVSCVNITLNDRDTERLSAYLCCLFMTMRRYNGKILAGESIEKNTAFSTHVPQEYGIRIQQSVKERIRTASVFDPVKTQDVARFSNHPAFAGYEIEETREGMHLHLPLRKISSFSSFVSHGREQEFTLTLFPIG